MKTLMALIAAAVMATPLAAQGWIEPLPDRPIGFGIVKERTVIPFKVNSHEDILGRLLDFKCDIDLGELLSMTIHILVDYPIYDWIDKNNAFNLTPECRNDNFFERGFSPDKPVELEIRVDPVVIEKALDNTYEDSDEVFEAVMAISKKNPDNPLFQADHWYVLNAKQEIQLPPELGDSGTLKAGFSTTWNE